MGSLEFLQERELRKKGVVARVYSDEPVAIRLRYIGTGTVTSVTVTTGTDITFVTSDGGTDAYEFATYDTVGKLVDAINADKIFEAKVLDTLRSKATATQFVDGAITAGTFFGQTVWDVLVDTSAADYIAYRLCYDRGFNRPGKLNHRVHLNEIKYLINLSGVTATAVKVYEANYEVPQKEEHEVFSTPTVDNSATAISWMSGEGQLTAKEGRELVVVLTDADDFTDTAAYLRVSGFIE